MISEVFMGEFVINVSKIIQSLHIHYFLPPKSLAGGCIRLWYVNFFVLSKVQLYLVWSVMEKVARATLRYLFQEYLRGPSVSYAINHITDSYKADTVEVANYLSERNWIRELWVYQNNQVTCRITVPGIEEINPVFIHNKLKKLISGLVSEGGRRSLMDIFKNKIEEYSIALDIVYQLEKLKLVNIIHNHGEIDIELTPHGWKFFEKKDKPLFTLMVAAC